jgi:hypothetical protein
MQLAQDSLHWKTLLLAPLNLRVLNNTRGLATSSLNLKHPVRRDSKRKGAVNSSS